MRLALSTTPDSVRLLDSKQDVARKTTLIMFKVLVVPGSADGGIELTFAQKDLKPLAISQADINRAIQTLRYNGLAETAQK